MIRNLEGKEIENMKSAIDPFTHIKIHLKKIHQNLMEKSTPHLWKTHFLTQLINQDYLLLKIFNGQE